VNDLIKATRSLIAGLDKSDVKRLIFVGGAGSLLVAPGVDIIDSGHLPEEYKAIAIAHRDAKSYCTNLISIGRTSRPPCSSSPVSAPANSVSALTPSSVMKRETAPSP
jgi:hypothetical protein